jgi:hypothetical protein
MTEKGEVAVDSRIGPPMLWLNIFGGILRERFEFGAHTGDYFKEVSMKLGAGQYP